MALITTLSPEKTLALTFASMMQNNKICGVIGNTCQKFIENKDWVGLAKYLSGPTSAFKSVGAADYEYIYNLTSGKQNVWKFLLIAQGKNVPDGYFSNLVTLFNAGEFDKIVSTLTSTHSPLVFSAQELQDVVDPEHVIQKVVGTAAAPAWTVPITWSIGAYGAVVDWGKGAESWTIGTADTVAEFTTGSADAVADFTTGAANTVADFTTGAANTVADFTNETVGSIEDITNQGVDAIKNTADIIADGATEAVEKVKDFGEKVGKALNPFNWG